MSTPGLFRRHARPVRLLAGLTVAIPLIIASTTVAIADTGGITQQSPSQGATLVGTAFGDQLHVSGAIGAVTFTQTSGADSVAVSSSGQVSAAATLAAGTYAAAGTDSDANGDTGIWTYTLNVLTQAPSGFSGTVVSVYQSEYGVSQQLGQSSGLPTVSTYQQEISQLTPLQLADLYNAVQQNPQWYQIPQLMQTVASGIPAGGAPTVPTPASTPASTQSVSARLLGSAKSSTSARSNASVKSSASVKADGGPPHPFVAGNCASGPTDEAIFALQIVIDVTSGVFNLMSIDASLPDPANIPFIIAGEITDVILTAFQIAQDSLSYQQTEANNCSGIQQGLEFDNIDNTTYQTYALLTSVATAITQLQSTASTTQQDVQNVQSSLTTMQATLGQAIASDTQAIQATVGSDTQGVTSQLQSDLNGINQNLTTIEGDESTLSQALGQSNTGTSAIQSSLSSDLTKILNEVDTTAGGLTSLITANDQQIMTTLKSNFSTQQGQYQADLKLRIEQALAASAVTGNIPQVQMMLPASQGGYLNSTPVGVQEVVTDDLNSLKALGAKITPSALANFNAANTALAAGQYVTAYNDYAACYVAVA